MTYEHPRLKYYPHHRDYIALANDFRPFVMFVHKPFYRSASVNTDRFGLREQYDAQGRFIPLETLRTSVPSCDVIIGGSTVFGVDATSDLKTIAHKLTKPARLCINLGVRGANSQQELYLFLALRRWLPKVDNVIILSGINNISFCSLPDTLYYPEYGGTFSEEYHYNAFHQQYAHVNADHQFMVRAEVHRYVDALLRRSRFLRGLVSTFIKPKPQDHASKPKMSFEQKCELTREMFDHDLATWSVLQNQLPTKVHFVLQPAITWTSKKLSTKEAVCFDADKAMIPSLRTYTRKDVYETYKREVEEACRKYRIDFHDANDWLNGASSDEDIFTDVCHLTDHGNKLLADRLRENLSWRAAA